VSCKQADRSLIEGLIYRPRVWMTSVVIDEASAVVIPIGSEHGRPTLGLAYLQSLCI